MGEDGAFLLGLLVVLLAGVLGGYVICRVKRPER
jgi:hypothetical protein